MSISKVLLEHSPHPFIPTFMAASVLQWQSRGVVADYPVAHEAEPSYCLALGGGSWLMSELEDIRNYGL